jgi:hypothetical protein
MARYFLHLRDGSDETLDPEGVEYASLDALRDAAMKTARDIMCGDVARGVINLQFRIDAERADGTLVYSLPFRDAVTITMPR